MRDRTKHSTASTHAAAAAQDRCGDSTTDQGSDRSRGAYSVAHVPLYSFMSDRAKGDVEIMNI